MYIFNIIRGIVSQGANALVVEGLILNIFNTNQEVIQEYDDDNYYLKNLVAGADRQPQISRGYNFTGIEYVRTFGSFTIERTQTIAYKGWVNMKRNAVGTSAAFITNIDDSAPFRGFELTMYGSTHASKADAIRVWLGNDSVSLNKIEVIWYDNDMPDDDFAYLEFDYDGSSTGAGCSLKINGITQTPTIGTDALAATIVSNAGVRIANRFGGDSVTSKIFALGSWQLAIDGTIAIKVNSDESAGLVSYDASGNGSYAAIKLNGSTESSFHITDNSLPSVQNELGYSTGLRFTDNGAVAHAYDAAVAKSTFEIEGHYYLDTISGHQPLFGILVDTGTKHGFLVRKNTAHKLEVIIYYGGTDQRPVSTTSFVANTWYKIKIQYINRALKVWFDDVLDIDITTTNDLAYDGTNNDITTGRYTISDVNKWEGIIADFKYTELNGSGTPIAEPIHLIAKSGDNTVINGGADSIGNFVWTNGALTTLITGAYSLIPVNQAIPTQDVLGNVLSDAQTGEVRYDAQIKGSSIGNFDDNLYYNLGDRAEIEIPNFEFETVVQVSAGVGGNGGWFIGAQTIFTTDITSGYVAGIRDDVVPPRFQIAFRGGTNNNSTLVPLVDEPNHIILKHHQSGIELWLNGVYELLNATPSSLNWGVGALVTLIGSSDNLLPLNGKMHSFKFYSSDASGNRVSELINLQFSETNGLVCHNIATGATAGSNAIMALGGSADGTQWGTSDVQYPKNLIEGYNTALPYGTANFYEIGTVDINGNIDIVFNARTNNTTTEFFCGSEWGTSGAPSRNGFLIFNKHDTTGWQINIATAINVQSVHIWGVIQLNPKIRYVHTVSTNNHKIYVDDVLELQFTEVIYWGTGLITEYSKKIYIGAFLSNDFDGTTGTSRGTDASGYVSNVSLEQVPINDFGADTSYTPADPNNPTLDMYGNALTSVGIPDLYPTENTYNRNPFDTYKFIQAGIDSTDSITYDIVGEDISRFYDGSQNDYITKQLVYSDAEFAEPMAGSAANFDGVLYGDLGDNSVYKLPYVELVFKGVVDAGWYIINNLYKNSGTARGGVLAYLNGSNVDVYISLTPTTVDTVTSSNTVSAGEYMDLNVKIYGTTVDIILNGVTTSGTYSGTILYSTDHDIQVIGATATPLSAITTVFTGTIYEYGIYELNSGGTRINELINLPFSETNGLVWYNIAADRPTGNTNADVILGGSSDGTQWLQNENKTYIHNLQYGATRAAYLPIIDPELFTNITEMEFEFVTHREWTGDDSPTEVLFSWDTTANESLFVLGGGTSSITGETFTIIAPILYGGTGNIRAGILDTITKGQHIIKLVWDGVDTYDFFLDGVQKTWVYAGTSAKFVSKITTVAPRIGSRNTGANGVQSYISAKFTCDEGVIEYNFDTDNTIKWTNTPAYVYIPADPNNSGFDVNGQPISNPDVVLKYNDINTTLNK